MAFQFHGATGPIIGVIQSGGNFAVPNPKAGLALLRRLEGMIGIAVEATELEDAALSFEKQVSGKRGEWKITIEDDGIGFTVPKRAGGKSNSRLGLVGMKERAALIGATIEIESVTGKGSTVFARLPMKRRGEGTE